MHHKLIKNISLLLSSDINRADIKKLDRPALIGLRNWDVDGHTAENVTTVYETTEWCNLI